MGKKTSVTTHSFPWRAVGSRTMGDFSQGYSCHCWSLILWAGPCLLQSPPSYPSIPHLPAATLSLCTFIGRIGSDWTLMFVYVHKEQLHLDASFEVHHWCGIKEESQVTDNTWWHQRQRSPASTLETIKWLIFSCDIQAPLKNNSQDPCQCQVLWIVSSSSPFTWVSLTCNHKANFAGSSAVALKLRSSWSKHQYLIAFLGTTKVFLVLDGMSHWLLLPSHPMRFILLLHVQQMCDKLSIGLAQPCNNLLQRFASWNSYFFSQ